MFIGMGKFLRFQPIFLPKIWGGNHIEKLKSWDEEVPQNCGEVWLVSDVFSHETYEKGSNQTLSQLIDLDVNHAYFSPSFRKKYQKFPLLIKIIDAEEDLSIQVHPNDEIAQKKHGCLGKTESWIILDHEKDAFLYLGWKKEMTRQEIQTASQGGWIDSEINQIQVQKNDLFFIPAGLVHSIGKGIVLGEIQQSSDVTYRLFDFNRKDAQGNLRDLHLEESLEAVSLDSYTTVKNNCDSIESQYFSYSLHKLNDNETMEISNNQLFWLIEGDEVEICSNEITERVTKHEPVWLPNSFEHVRVKCNGIAHFLTIQIP